MTKIELFLRYAQYHPVRFFPMPSNKEKILYCNYKCNECCCVEVCNDDRLVLSLEEYKLIKEQYPEYVI